MAVFICKFHQAASQYVVDMAYGLWLQT